MTFTHKQELRRAGYTDTAVRTGPHEGGPEYEARLGNGLIVGVPWGHYFSRFMEQNPSYTVEDALELLDLEWDDVRDRQPVISETGSRNEFHAYMSMRRKTIDTAEKQRWQPIVDVLRQSYTAIIDKIALSPEAKEELIATLTARQEELDTARFREACSRYATIDHRLGRVIENMLVLQGFDDKEALQSLAAYAEERKRLENEQKTLADICEPVEHELKAIDYSLTAALGGGQVCKLSDLFEALVRRLEQLGKQDATMYAMWRQALIEFLEDCPYELNQYVPHSKTSAIWVDEDVVTYFPIGLNTYSDAQRSDAVTTKIATLETAFYTQTTDDSPLIPTK